MTLLHGLEIEKLCVAVRLLQLLINVEEGCGQEKKHTKQTGRCLPYVTFMNIHTQTLLSTRSADEGRMRRSMCVSRAV